MAFLIQTELPEKQMTLRLVTLKLKDHSYRRSFSRFTLQFQLCVTLGDNVFYNGKPQACAAGGFGAALIHAVKTFEDSLLVLLGNTDSGVFYYQISMTISCIRLYIHASSGIVIPNGIIAQIV